MSSFIISQLLSNLPTLLVLLLGGAMAIVFMQRAQTAAWLTLGGVGLMLLTIVIGIGISVTSMQMQMHGESRELWMTVTRGSSLLLGLMRAVSLAIILAAVFVGREPAPGSQFPNNLK